MNKIVSDKQLRANKRNAKKGGVKTFEGKQISKMNALSFGMYSPVLFDEDEEIRYKQFVVMLIDEYNPKAFSENTLIHQIALYEIKLYRLARMEEETREILGRSAFIKVENHYSSYSEEDLQQNEVVGDMYKLAKISAKEMKFGELEKYEIIQKYREMLETRKIKCINDLIKIKYLKRTII